MNFTPYGKANQRQQYLCGLALVSVVTLVSHHVQGYISEDNLMLWFLVSVIVAALYWGEGPAILVAFLRQLNEALAKTPGPWTSWSVEQLLRKVEQLPAELRMPVRNHGGGHWNHSFFWQAIGPVRGHAPDARLRRAVERSFGSWKAFQERFVQAALDRFGSGWAWLVLKPKGVLEIRSTANQDSPLLWPQCRPLLGVDVWEHAYYLKYQNRRKEYLENFWNVVQWDFVSSRLG